MKPSILLAVDDKPDNLFVLEQLIMAYVPHCRVVTARDGAGGLAIAGKSAVDVAVIDVQMTGMNGVEMCRQLKSKPETEHIPVILITAHRTTSEFRIKGLEAGADDFICRPVDNTELAAKIKVMLRIKNAEDALRRQKAGLEVQVRERTKELERTCEALRRERDGARRYLDVAGVMILALDTRGNISLVNRKGCEILGYEEHEIMGENWFDAFIPERAKDETKAEFFRILKGGFDPEKPVDGLVLTKGGEEKSLIWNNRVATNSRGEVVGTLGSGEDISDRKELEAQLRQSQKMEAVGTLAGGIAHDFNNILAAIIGFAQIAQLDVPQGSGVASDIDQVVKAGLRAKELVQQILVFSRPSEQHHDLIRISPVIKEAVKLLTASLPSNIEIRPDIKTGMGMVMADPTQIHQILMNLCTNAAHSMDEQGGVLRVNFERVTVSPAGARRIGGIRAGGHVELTVSDTGCGMSHDIVEKIFDPYFSTKAKGEGTGLGLSVVHGIVREHQGGIVVESEPGKGSAFHVYFPCHDPKTGKEEAASVAPPMGGHERILLVDDEPALMQLGRRMLVPLGYDVVTETDSVAALARFREHPEQFDLVVSDMTMPHMTGDVLFREIRKIRSDIPFIICTGYNRHMNPERAKAMGINALAKKPYEIGEMTRAIRKVLDGENG